MYCRQPFAWRDFTGVPAAREYLVAEEGDEADAILSYRTDRMEVAE
jgi:hypothetical protein